MSHRETSVLSLKNAPKMLLAYKNMSEITAGGRLSVLTAAHRPPQLIYIINWTPDKIFVQPRNISLHKKLLHLAANFFLTAVSRS